MSETLHGLFEAQAARTPHAIALTCEGRSLTYGELNRRASRLAGLLKARGVTRERLVGIHMDRSLDLLVALLGVLKAGGAYLPLDPTYPADRIAFMLDDAEAAVLISDGAFPAPAGFDAARVLRIDQVDWSGGLEPGQSGGSGADLAYVIYTSGSTGVPKGCEVTHANVTRLFLSTEGWFDFGPADVWTLFHSYAFDFSVWEIWGALLYGGRLVVVPHCVSRDPDRFHAMLREERVTVLNQTPSAFRQLIRADEVAGGSLDLRLVIFGGEALDLACLRPWLARHPDHAPRLVNMYGITETTVHVTYRPISRADVEAGRGSVIGGPIPDLTLQVVDADLRPVDEGELLVGGAGVARGYLRRPELTAHRFIPDPTGAPGRVYRSGDLVRRLPDGDLEYLGRIDQQVKVRGHRVELGEIEAAIQRLPGVRESAVLLREDTPGDQRLVAYVVGTGLDPAEARAALREMLPDYMVPSALVTLERFPLTQNGKLDRNALPAPQIASAGCPGAVPANDLEARIARIWAGLLGVDQVSVEDNFFDLGGHSLLLMQLQARLRDALQRDVKVVQLFQHPTVRSLAAALAEAPIAQDRSAAIQERARLQREAIARRRAAAALNR